MFKLGQQMKSETYPEFGVGTVQNVKQTKGKFTNRVFTVVFITWPKVGTLTSHVFPSAQSAIDWQLKQA